MVKRLLRPLRRWAAVEAVLARIAGQVKTWPADDFGKFVSASIGTGMAGAVAALPPPTEPLLPDPLTSIAPATFEMRFMKLHAEGRFDEMWEMLAEDAQRAWGGRETFMRDMPRLEDDVELLDMQVVSVKVVEEWIDQAHQRAYATSREWSCVIASGSSGESGHSIDRSISCRRRVDGEHCVIRQELELRWGADIVGCRRCFKKRLKNSSVTCAGIGGGSAR